MQPATKSVNVQAIAPRHALHVPVTSATPAIRSSLKRSRQSDEDAARQARDAIILKLQRPPHVVHSPKRKIQQGESSKENKKKTRAEDEASTSRVVADDATTICNPQERTDKSDGEDDSTSLEAKLQPHFSLDSARRIKLTLAGFDVGAAFRLLQEEAAPFVNDDTLKVSIKKLYLML
ncbi:hypothetical protein DFQ27_008473 [Actinomortierella ambigua]|uniref:Uncharacterized protein n=1 Tax=Actinomortierella ambigua TaxID=1343610 RepID=A0A9P6PRB3_9FUNG|nr:hypothetical protein DFQ27_008473 [Actinomortierella ambigua]